MIAKFNSEKNARNFSNRTIKASAIILGDDNKYWVVNLATFEKLTKAGHEALK